MVRKGESRGWTQNKGGDWKAGRCPRKGTNLKQGAMCSWNRLGPSPSQGCRMSTWLLVREGQRAVVTGTGAGLHYICSTRLNTASALVVPTSSKGVAWGAPVGWGVARPGPKGGREDICGKVRELAPNSLGDLGHITSLGLVPEVPSS